MNDYALKIVAGILFFFWLLLVLPGWVLGMLYAGRFSFLPDGPMTADLWALTAAFYVPPILAAVAVYRTLKAKRQKRNA